MPKSKCCEAPLRTGGGIEGTNFWVCEACNKPADIGLPLKVSFRKQHPDWEEPKESLVVGEVWGSGGSGNGSLAKKVEEFKKNWEKIHPEDPRKMEKFRNIHSPFGMAEKAGGEIYTEFDLEGILEWLETSLREVEEEAKKEMFNLSETKKDWQETFYESDWEPNTLEKTDVEIAISSELSYFLPRHMEVYDWNLPYIDYIILVIRKHVNLNTK